MNDIYLFLIIAIAVLAIIDLSIGVSNDAVNFLNSAIGSKAASFRTIMIVASVGMVLGALSSSGMMEIAKSGIFNPSQFYFNEIIIIFLTVIIADIFLLDFFNSIGFPTSTTVSIVFELLGAATCIAVFKIYDADESFSTLHTYLNLEKTTDIIVGILLSVGIAFTIGALVQYFTRILIGFDFEKRSKWVAAAFGGVGITGIFQFIVVKGLKGSPVLENAPEWIMDGSWLTLAIYFVFWTLVSYSAQVFLKTNIYKLIILLGTFAIAMSFAGNDLVNFAGVPIGAYEGYKTWVASGIPAESLTMESLKENTVAPTVLLLFAGAIMVFTLWTSEKARRVIKTSVDLSRQDEGKERFQANFISQQVVGFFMMLNKIFNFIMPKSANNYIKTRFIKPEKEVVVKTEEAPAFDMVRAAVNLMVASVLISFATSMKLPLSTTYVTFMVAMGSSLADRAWGSDSAVYRVAGVLNVISGWFITAFAAFTSAALLAFIIYYFGHSSLIVLFSIALALIIRNHLRRKKATAELIEDELLRKAESTSIKGVIGESSKNVSTIMKRAGKVYAATLEGLVEQDVKKLKNAKKYTEKLDGEVDELKGHIFYYIKNLKGHDVGASRFYLLIQDKFQDIAQSLELISKASLKHVKNNHKGLKPNQIDDLKEIEDKLLDLFSKTREEFDKGRFGSIGYILKEEQMLYDYVSARIEKQIERTKEADSSSKNTTLYFTILLETKDLISATLEVLELYYTEHKKASVKI